MNPTQYTEQLKIAANHTASVAEVMPLIKVKLTEDQVVTIPLAWYEYFLKRSMVQANGALTVHALVQVRHWLGQLGVVISGLNLVVTKAIDNYPLST